MAVTLEIISVFRELDKRRNVAYQGEFEPIPDVCLFSRQVSADWRRRNSDTTLKSLLLAIEIKASERKNGRLIYSEIAFDINKLAAHQFKVKERGYSFCPVMMICDTAPSLKERMSQDAINSTINLASDLQIAYFYLSPEITKEFIPSIYLTDPSLTST